jgi:hypothetical protein
MSEYRGCMRRRPALAYGLPAAALKLQLVRIAIAYVARFVLLILFTASYRRTGLVKLERG